MIKTPHQLVVRTVLGTIAGIAIATILAAMVVVSGGGWQSNGNENAIVSPGQAIASYYVAGVVGGALAGAASVLGSSIPARIVIGLCATLPLCIGIGVAYFGPLLQWGGDEWTIVLALAAAMTATVSSVKVAKADD